MKKILIFTFCLFLTVLTMAQTKELSIGSGVLFGYTGDLMYRKFKPDLQSAIRVQISMFNLNREIGKPFKNNIYNLGAVSNTLKTNKKYSFGAGLSVGKQKKINNLEKFQFYKGFDLGLNGSRYISKTTESIFYNIHYDTVRVIQANRREFQSNDLSINYKPFLGIRYPLLPNLNLSIESGLNIVLGRTAKVSTFRKYSIDNQTSEMVLFAETYDPDISYLIHINPFAKLWISYNFNRKK